LEKRRLVMSGLIAAVRTAFAQKVEDLSDEELDAKLRANGQAVAAIDGERGAVPRDANNEVKWRIGAKLARLEEERRSLNRELARRSNIVNERQETSAQKRERETLEAVAIEPASCDDFKIADAKAFATYRAFTEALEAKLSAERRFATRDELAKLSDHAMACERAWQAWSGRLEVLRRTAGPTAAETATRQRIAREVPELVRKLDKAVAEVESADALLVALAEEAGKVLPPNEIAGSIGAVRFPGVAVADSWRASVARFLS
jgi:hypothetical protein